jgi:nitrate reductase gamma subunit
MLTPHVVYEPFISAGNKQLMAMVSGGIAGLLAFIGVSLLLHRRLTDPRIRATSKTSDIALLWICCGAAGAGPGHHSAVGPASGRLGHDDAWPNGASASSPSAAAPWRCWPEAGWIFKAHMFLGMRCS